GPGEYLAEPGWIYAEEVDRWVDTIAMIQPTETRLSWRRKSLTNIILPMREVALIFPEKCAQVRRDVQALHVAALAGELADEHVERTFGHALEVGLDRWGVARTLAVGEWSEVFETLAGFSFLRLVEAPPTEEWEATTKIVIEHVTRYFLPLEEIHAKVEDIMNKLRVHAVDPDSEWEWILPKYYEYRRARLSD
ncbi:MAG: hypothetical protein V3T22_02495, partial [Planctomycetota bacterium]